MNSPSMWFLPITLSAALFSCSCSRSQLPETRATIEVAPPFTAEKWLKWNKSSRMVFIAAYLVGRWDGVKAGCFDAKRAVSSLPNVSGFTPQVADEMWLQCGTGYKPSNRTFESYEEESTRFYTSYPEDRIVQIQDVLILLAGDSKLTAEDIHKRIKITENPQH